MNNSIIPVNIQDTTLGNAPGRVGVQHPRKKALLDTTGVV